jgi:hypothetical protein
MTANNATTIADGMFVTWVPAPFMNVMSEPKTASNRTASQITMIASEAHIASSFSHDQRLSAEAAGS